MCDRPDDRTCDTDPLQREIAERERAERALLRRLDMERLVADTSRRFINLAPELFDAEVARTLQRIGEFARADRAYVFQLREDGKLKDSTHEWCAAGIPPEIGQLQGLPVDDFPWWMDPLKRLEEVHISNVAALPPEARFEQQHLLEQDVQSLVLVPMAAEGSLVGFLGFDAVSTAKDWRREDTALLRTIGDVFVNAMQRNRDRKTLLRRAELVRVVADASRRFIDLPTDRFDAEIASVLEAIGRFCVASRVCVFEFRDHTRIMTCTQEWCAAGLEPKQQSFAAVPVRSLAWLIEQLRRRGSAVLADLDELPAAERRVIAAEGIGSLAVVRMGQGESVDGFLACGSSSRDGGWTPEEVTFLEMITDVLVAAIRRGRTEEALHEAELGMRQLQKMEAVGQLAGGVAHDFNNVLAVIGGNARFVVDALGPDHPARADVKEILQATNRAAGLVRQLLAFARRQLLQPKVLDLNSVVQDVAHMLRRLVGENIELEISLEPELRLIRADPGQMDQVLFNLAVNARDAMPRGGRMSIVTANLDTAPSPAASSGRLGPGPWVALALRDTGSGMDEPTRSRIFEPFFTTKEVGQGTGLGLSTVYGIVTQSGGDVAVESELDVGTTFTMIFPVVSAPATAGVTASEPLPVQQSSETVLVLEDEPLVRKMVRRILSSHGYSVLEAGYGERAIELAEQQPIHLVLSDVVLPGMSGPECCEKLRSRQPALAVLYMSGYADEAIIRQGVQDCATAVLRKPFSQEALLRAVRAALDEGRSTSVPTS